MVLMVSSLRRGHANLLCIAPILTYVPKDESSAGIRVNRHTSPASLRRMIVPGGTGMNRSWASAPVKERPCPGVPFCARQWICRARRPARARVTHQDEGVRLKARAGLPCLQAPWGILGGMPVSRGSGARVQLLA